MSTILNTLKKLEEEKSVLEKNINLKGLLLQGQDSVYPQVNASASRKWGTIGGLIAAGVLLAGLLLYFSQTAKTSRPEITPAYVQKPSVQAHQVKKPIVPKKTNPGFALAGIQEIPPRAIEDPMTEPMTETLTDSFGDDDFFGPEDTLIMPQENAPEVFTETLSAGSEEIREIESLIQTATESYAIETHGFEEIPFLALNNTPAIPGLKVKGIIFLNQDNPVNHIFVSTPNEKNRKLKVGENLMGASLETIEAQKAVFSYQGQRVEQAIGE